MESFNGRLRDEFLAVEQFDSLLEAQVLIEDRRIEYNTKRPHSNLGWLTPAAYAEQRRAERLVGLSSVVSRRGSGHAQQAVLSGLSVDSGSGRRRSDAVRLNYSSCQTSKVKANGYLPRAACSLV